MSPRGRHCRVADSTQRHGLECYFFWLAGKRSASAPFTPPGLGQASDLDLQPARYAPPGNHGQVRLRTPRYSPAAPLACIAVEAGGRGLRRKSRRRPEPSVFRISIPGPGSYNSRVFAHTSKSL